MLVLQSNFCLLPSVYVRPKGSEKACQSFLALLPWKPRMLETWSLGTEGLYLGVVGAYSAGVG